MTFVVLSYLIHTLGIELGLSCILWLRTYSNGNDAKKLSPTVVTNQTVTDTRIFNTFICFPCKAQIIYRVFQEE